MMEPFAGLTLAGCRRRQERLRLKMADAGLDAALLLDPRHIHYFSGHWEYSGLPSALLIERDEPALLVVRAEPEYSVSAEIEIYQAARLATLVDDIPGAVLQPLQAQLAKLQRLGCDGVLRERASADLKPVLRELRRCKDEDEVALVRRAVAACEAAYARAREVLTPGVSEIEVYAQMYAAATVAAGERIGPMGNDFQSGSPGGPPRRRTVEAGELMPLDVSIVVRGYHCDLCRTFAVDGQPSAAQRDAHERVLAALQWVEQNARAGVSCRALYEEVLRQLGGYRGWKFPHHLGHGVGLSAHEAPRLNPNWDDTLREGDLFTVEPGLYGEELRAGIRIEHNYRVTPDGLERLSQYPTAL
jgi:Xaa-Pro aminopeptidase